MRFKFSLVFLLLVASGLTTFFLYRNSLSYPFQFDDFSNVVQNRSIRYLWHPRIFTESAQARPRPVASLSYALDFTRAQGLSVSAFRTTNLLLHALNGWLAALLFLQWFAGRRLAWWGAFGVAGVFLTLPLAVDSVVYLSARSTLLSLFFVQIALLCHGVKRANFVSYFGFFAAALAGFLSKESSVALLPLLLLIHRVRGRTWREAGSYVIPLLVGGATHLLLKSSYLDSAWRGFFHIQGEVEIRGFEEYARLSLALWPRIVEIFFHPSLMAVDHEIFLPSSWSHPLVVKGILIWILAVIVAAAWWRKPSFWQLPFLWVFASLAPTNSFFPVLDPFSERHYYLAAPALAWGVGIIFLHLSKLWLFPIFLGLVVWGAQEGQKRAYFWRSATALWGDTYQKYPRKFRVAFNQAMYLIQEQGDFAGSFAILQKYFGDTAPGHLPYQQQEIGTRLAANSLRYLGKTREDILKFQGEQKGFYSDYILLKALRGIETEGEWRQRWTQVMAAHEKTEIAAASEESQVVKHSLELMMVMHLVERGERAEALQLLERVMLPFGDGHIPYWEMRDILGDLYRASGRQAEALQQYDQTAYQYKVFKQFPEPLHRKIYEMRMAQNDYARAADAIGELLRVQSDNPELRRLYGEALQKMKHRNASRHLGEAEFYRDNYIPPHDEREHIRP